MATDADLALQFSLPTKASKPDSMNAIRDFLMHQVETIQYI